MLRPGPDSCLFVCALCCCRDIQHILIYIYIYILDELVKVFGIYSDCNLISESSLSQLYSQPFEHDSGLLSMIPGYTEHGSGPFQHGSRPFEYGSRIFDHGFRLSCVMSCHESR